MGSLIPLALFVRSGIFSSNVTYILDKDLHLTTRELVNDGFTNTVCFVYPIVLWGFLFKTRSRGLLESVEQGI